MKKTLSRFLMLALLITCICAVSLHANATTVASGTCGDTATWTLDHTGTLTISGTGAIADYSSAKQPWHNNLDDIKSLVIKSGITTIGKSAFYNCNNLATVSIPSTVTTISLWAFSSCDNLTSVVIPNGVTTLEAYAFSYCYALASVTLPNTLTLIDTEAFYNCDALTAITLPSSLTTIGSWAFANCDSLTSISVPASVVSIGELAFYNCDNLTRINVSSSNPNYSNDASGVFFDKQKTTLIQYPKGIYGSYTIPSSVKTIGPRAFAYCDDLLSVTIPNSVTSIGEEAFYDCDSLTTVTIPASVAVIDSFAFYACDNLKFSVNSGNPNYSNDSRGCLLNKQKTTLLQAPRNISGSYTVPSSVTTIGDYAFTSCWNLTNVVFSNKLTTIGKSAFEYCYGLSELKLPDSLKVIDAYAFGNCDALTTVTIPMGTTTVGSNAFSWCNNLTNAIIGVNVTDIGTWAFDGCPKLASVFIGGKVTNIGRYAFADCDLLKTVYFAGSNAQWNTVQIGDYNEPLKNATIYFNQFPDVRPGHWFYNAVQFAVKKGYFSGHDNGSFGATDDITRQDFVVVLSRIAKADLSKYNGKTSFTDVPSNAYFAKAIHWATANGIISGYNSTKFGVDDKLTREQLVTIFSRYAQKKGVNVNPSAAALNKLNTYSDANKINPAMKNAVAWALQNKVISGMTSTTVGPQGKATRAQVAAILMNINAYKVIPGI